MPFPEAYLSSGFFRAHHLWTHVVIWIHWNLAVMFSHTTAISGWTRPELYVVLLAWNIGWMSDALGRSIQYLEEHIRRGTLDPHLVKPVDAQFVMLFGNPEIAGILFVIGYALPLVYLLWREPTPIMWSHLPIFLFLILLANIMWLAIKTIAMTFNFWRQRLDNLNMLVTMMADVGKYPPAILPKPLQYIIYSILPFAFLAIVPAQTLLGAISWRAVIGACVITIILVIISRVLWNVAIKNYSSASS